MIRASSVHVQGIKLFFLDEIARARCSERRAMIGITSHLWSHSVRDRSCDLHIYLLARSFMRNRNISLA
jgi:hypothetical protein